MKRLAIRLWLPVSILGSWEILNRISENIFFPSPSKIFARGLEVIDYSWLATYLYPTCLVFLSGYVVGIVSGLVLGSLLAAKPLIHDILMPSAVFIRKTPSVVKVPVILAILGIGYWSQLVSVAIPVAFITMVVSAKAVHEPLPSVSDTSKLLGLSRLQAICYLFLPSKKEELIASARGSIQVALIVTILSEILLGRNGIGMFTVNAKDLFDPELMWVGIFVVGTIGFLAHAFFEFVDRSSRTKLTENGVRT